MGGFSIMHWLIFLVVVIAIFGTSKIRNAGKDLGSAVKGFKDAVKEDDKPKLNERQEETAVVEEVKVTKDKDA